MKYSVSYAAMRAADEEEIKRGTPAAELMERAGKALAERTLHAMKEYGVSDALFVCGGGNNGGDGFVAARILMEAEKDVQVLCLAEKFSPLCAEMKARFHGDILGRIPRRRYRLIVDCLFGTGLTREIGGAEEQFVSFINYSGAHVIACDVPSGLKEGGVRCVSCVKADETLTIGQYKNALLLGDGADLAGKITLAPIGIPIGRGVEIWERADVKTLFPKRKSNTHKATYGNAGLVAGKKYSGAALLAAEGCLRSGAGYTRLFADGRHYSSFVGKLPACILMEGRDLEELLQTHALAVGMGEGTDEELYALVKTLLLRYAGTLVLDADALNVLHKFEKEILKDKVCRVVITPHLGEFARLTGKDISVLMEDPVREAEAFAKEYDVTVVLKSNRTVIVDGTQTAINITGSPALAKGGSGDVLAGFLAGTLARGIMPFEAACAACYVLGRAGELAAVRFGEYATTASEVLTFIPEALLELE